MRRPELVRAIGRWALTAAVINSVVGSGIFGLPGPLIALCGYWSPLAVLLAGGCILVVVLCFAEVSGRFDQAGGPYLYTREALGPVIGFHVGWMHIWTRVIAAAAVLNIFASYLATLVPAAGAGGGRVLAMAGAMAIVTAVNIAGVRQAAFTVNVFTIAKLVPLVAVIVLGLVMLDTAVLASQRVEDVRWTDAILLLVFSYGGFESAIIAGSESRAPQRDTPFALVVGMTIVTIVYSLLQLAVVAVLPGAAAKDAPVSASLAVLVGSTGATLGSVAVLISTYGWLTGFALMTPRISYAMAAHGELPGVVAHVDERTRTPTIAILINSALALALAVASGFGQLATASAISRLVILGTTCAALIALRRKWGASPQFRVPAGRWFALAGIGFCVWLLSTRRLAEIWFLLIVVTAGGFVQMVMSRRNPGAHAA